MARLFDIEDIDQTDPQPVNNDPSEVHVERFLQLHESRITNIKELIGKIPGDGEILFLHTTNSFSAFTFIPLVIKECGIIEELCVSTYSINSRIINSLLRYVDKALIKSVYITVSDSIRQKNTRVYDQLIALSEKKPIKVTLSWNHSKIALIRAGNYYLDIEGSGNWAENAMHEQYVFVNSRKVFEFRKNEILNGINPVAV